MSGQTTLSGGTTLTQFSTANGSGAALAKYFGSAGSYAMVSGSGSTSVSGAVVVGGNGGGALSVSGATAIADTSAGYNKIAITSSKVAVFAAGGDTISASTGATSLFGASSGRTTFAISGDKSSISGGSGAFLGTVSGSNSTLVGGSGVTVATVSGSYNKVFGGTGVTAVDLRQSTGVNVVSTNASGNSGSLVALLGNGPTVVVGGSGNSAIAGGAGQDSYVFINGHAGGTEFIYNFSGADTIAFGGYSYSGNNMPTETIGAYGDVISLTDGTKITLVGIDHKLFS